MINRDHALPSTRQERSFYSSIFSTSSVFLIAILALTFADALIVAERYATSDAIRAFDAKLAAASVATFFVGLLTHRAMIKQVFRTQLTDSAVLMHFTYLVIWTTAGFCSAIGWLLHPAFK
jgi:hypothetical protein